MQEIKLVIPKKVYGLVCYGGLMVKIIMIDIIMIDIADLQSIYVNGYK